MKRRSFLQASVAALSSAAAAATVANSAESAPCQLFELRCYTLKAAKVPVLDDYLQKAFLPALKRYGMGPVGVFVEKSGGELKKVYVLIVCSSADQATTLPARLAADEQHRKAGADYFAAPASDPVYLRIESSLLAAIQGMPKLEKPDTARPRLLNLRVYESHSERAAQENRDVRQG